MNNNDFLQKATDYKKYVASRYIAIESEGIAKKLAPFSQYLMSVKYDGHYYALTYENETVTFINRSGKVAPRIHLHDELEAHFKAKGIDSLFIAGELYCSSQKRTHQFNVTTELSGAGEALKFAAFDIVELNQESFREKTAFDRLDTLKTLIPAEGNFHLVEHKITDSIQEIQEYFKEVVEIGKQEGIVVKTEGFSIFKVKPKFTFDAVIVGFAQSDGDRSDLLRDFLLAFRKADGSYQIFAHLSHGFNDDQRRELLEEYKQKVVPSDYTEVARNRLGFQMVKPETVVEFSCIDVINQDSKGNILKMNLAYDDEKGYTANYQQPTISATIPVFMRFREDKQASIEDISFDQILDVVGFDDISTEQYTKLAETQIIHREVYKKESRGSVMVKKFVLLKTNKEDLDDFPGYVLHLTDFSSGRKDPLKKDVRVSDSETQINELLAAELASGIKAGWEKVEAS